MKLLKKKKGFTLIELIVVIAILAVLALILVPTVGNYIDEATRARDLANVRAIYSEVKADILILEKDDFIKRWSVDPTTEANAAMVDGQYATNSVPDGMIIYLTINDGEFKSFSAKVGGREYADDTTGQIVEVKD